MKTNETNNDSDTVAGALALLETARQACARAFGIDAGWIAKFQAVHHEGVIAAAVLSSGGLVRASDCVRLLYVDSGPGRSTVTVVVSSEHEINDLATRFPQVHDALVAAGHVGRPRVVPVRGPDLEEIADIVSETGPTNDAPGEGVGVGAKEAA